MIALHTTYRVTYGFRDALVLTFNQMASHHDPCAWSTLSTVLVPAYVAGCVNQSLAVLHMVCKKRIWWTKVIHSGNKPTWYTLGLNDTQANPFYENYIHLHFGDRIPRRVSNCSLLSFSALSSNLLSFFFTISQNTTDTSGKTKAIKKRYHGKAWRLPLCNVKCK